MPEHFVHEMLYASINFAGQTGNQYLIFIEDWEKRFKE